MISATLALVLFLQTILAGDPCPPRENIYPCSCINVKGQGRLMKTIVQCHRFHDKASLDAVFHSLKYVKLEHFHLYDSFWNEKRLNETKVFPHDWLISLKSKSIEIVDTTLATCFACDLKFPCRNIETTRFVTINSTSAGNFGTLCPTGKGNSYPWVNCMNNLQELSLIQGKIETLGADFFPIRLNSLKKLNLSRNDIKNINPRAFQGLDTILSIDLSHNRIVSLENLFFNTMELLYLDVSWNKIETLDEMFFRKLPKLKKFFAKSNYLARLVEKHWENIPQSLSYVDLEDNPIKCDCNMNWVMSTFSNQTYVKGYCSNEKLYISKSLKFRIKALLQRCEKMNKASTLKPKLMPIKAEVS